jgi:DNA repair protein RadC
MVYLKDSKITVERSEKAAKIFLDLLLAEDAVDRAKEHFYVAHLDIRNRVNLVELVTLGTLTGSLVHPREKFRRAIIQGSAAVIVGHNHPSGEVEPSDEDTKVTKLLFEAGNLLGIALLDHIIFSPSGFFSFKDNQTWELRERGWIRHAEL